MGHPEFGEVWPCVCRTADKVRHLQEISGLTAAERQRRLEDLEVEGRPGTRRMLEACRAFCEDPTGIVTIWGGVGNGKTMALQAVVNELNERGVGTVYITAFDLVNYFQDAFSRQEEGESASFRQRRRRFEQTKVLALDEFDKAPQTPWAQGQLSSLIEKRSRLGEDGIVGTLIAMNSNPAVQAEWVASRLMDGRNRLIHNEDGDIRPALAR